MINIQILTSYKYYLPLIYIITVIGIILSLIFKPNYPYGIILTILSVTFLCIYLEMIYDFFFKNKSDDFKNKFIRFHDMIGIISLLITPLLIGFFSNNKNITNETNLFTITILISFSYTLIYNFEVRKRIFNEKINISEIYVGSALIILLVILFLPNGLNSLNYLFSYILGDIPRFLTVSIAIIMLCATLSALSFTYHSTICNKKDQKEMKKNGEGYFIATILSMISIISIFIASLIKIKTPIIINLNLDNIINFLLLNIYSILFMIAFSFIAITIYCLLKCSISSLKILKLDKIIY